MDLESVNFHFQFISTFFIPFLKLNNEMLLHYERENFAHLFMKKLQVFYCFLGLTGKKYENGLRKVKKWFDKNIIYNVEETKFFCLSTYSYKY